MTKDGERIATLEANFLNLRRTNDAILEYMKEGREWREDTTKCLVIVVNNQEGMKEYQIRCDADRDNMEHDAIELAKRVTETEGFQRRQIKGAIGLSIVINFLVMGGAKLIGKYLS